MPIKTASQQDTYDHMIGAGAFQFSWWEDLHVTGVNPNGDVESSGWKATVGCEDPEDDGKVVMKTFGHKDVLAAARKVLAHDYSKDPKYLPFTSQACKVACRALIFDADDADFDACSSDELLQLIVLGTVAYG